MLTSAHLLARRYDIQHNDTTPRRLNCDTQQKNVFAVMLGAIFNVLISVIILSVIHCVECHNVDCHYCISGCLFIDCHYAEFHYAQCHSLC